MIKIKKLKLFGFSQEKDFFHIKFDKKQMAIPILREILSELKIYPLHEFMTDVHTDKEKKITLLNDYFIHAENKTIDLEIFFGKDRIVLVFRTRNIIKIKKIID